MMPEIPERAWREGAGAFDPRLSQTPLLHSLAELMRAAPDALAVAEPNATLSFLEFWAAISARARAIATQSPAGPPVGVLLPAGIEHAVSILGCVAAGRICMLLDPSAPASRTADVIRAAGVQLVLGATKSPPDDCVPFNPNAVPSPTSVLKELPADAPAFIVATSGSSGAPKLIVHSQRSLAFQAHGNVGLLNIRPADRYLFTGSPSSFASVIHFITPLLAGAAAVMCDIRAEGFSRLFSLLEHHQVSVLRTGPSLLRALSNMPSAAKAFDHVRAVRLIGEPLLASDVTALRGLLPEGARIMSSYSATETIPFERDVGSNTAPAGARVSAGKMRAGGAFVILDESGQPCQPGAAGELLIRSRYNALGEWRDGRCVPGRLARDPADPDRSIYRTGDLALLDENGELVVLGRIDRQVKINGNRVELPEIEEEIRAFADVVDVAVVARADDERTQIFAFVVAAPSAAAGLPDRLRDGLASRLPNFMLPARILQIDALPYLSGWKLDTAALLARGETLPN